MSIPEDKLPVISKVRLSRILHRKPVIEAFLKKCWDNFLDIYTVNFL